MCEDCSCQFRLFRGESHQPFRQYPTGTVQLRWQQELQLPPPQPFASLSTDSRLEALQLALWAALALVPAWLHCVSHVGVSVLQSQMPVLVDSLSNRGEARINCSEVVLCSAELRTNTGLMSALQIRQKPVTFAYCRPR